MSTRHLTIAALSLALAACTTTSPDVVQPWDAQRLSQVQDATVLSVRPVTVDGRQSGAGGWAGAIAGGLAGGTHSHGAEQAALAVAGAVVGGLVGNAIERTATSEQANELVLQMKSGERRAIVQAQAGETFQPGDAVILVTTNGRTRVTRAPANPVSEPALPPPVYSPTGRRT